MKLKFGAVVMVGVTVYVIAKIYDHPIVISLNEQKLNPVPVAKRLNTSTSYLIHGE